MTRNALARMPHKDAMLLIDRVRDLGPDHIDCLASDHRALDYPLRIAGRLEAVSLIELGAQAAAAHASVHGIGGAHTGLLLALRQVDVLEQAVDALEAPLIVRAERISGDDGGAQYRFSIRAGEVEVIRGQAFLSMQAAP